MPPFDEVKQRFWDTGVDYLVEPPLTDEALRDAEAKLGVTLPASLVELLRIQNGGYVTDEFVRFPTGQPTSWAEDHVPFEKMMGIGSGMLTILESAYLTEEWEMPRELVLLSGEGEWWIGLDYREAGEPPVVWYDNEVGEDIRLASDFRSFIEGLEPEQEDEGE